MSVQDPYGTEWTAVRKAWDELDLPKEPAVSDPQTSEDWAQLVSEHEHYGAKLRKQYAEVVKDCNANEAQAQKLATTIVAMQKVENGLRLELARALQLMDIAKKALDVAQEHG